MIIDTSAIVAIIKGEPDGIEYSECLIANRSELKMSAATYVEAGIVVDSIKSDIASWKLDEIIRILGVEIYPVTVTQAQKAREAYARFGKGNGHPAQLNFGDCFALALSLETGESLLYKGDDFARAGISNALNST